jgi:hypothetical protein
MEIIQKKTQKYIKNEKTGLIYENPNYDSLYELLEISSNRVLILEKQFIFTGSKSIIPIVEDLK